MTDFVIKKQPLVREDVLIGNGEASQERGGSLLTVNKVNAAWYATSADQIAASPVELGVIILTIDEKEQSELETGNDAIYGIYKYNSQPPLDPVPPSPGLLVPPIIYPDDVEIDGHWALLENRGPVDTQQIESIVCSMLNAIFQEDTPGAGDVTIDPDAACGPPPMV